VPSVVPGSPLVEVSTPALVSVPTSVVAPVLAASLSPPLPELVVGGRGPLVGTGSPVEAEAPVLVSSLSWVSLAEVTGSPGSPQAESRRMAIGGQKTRNIALERNLRIYRNRTTTM